MCYCCAALPLVLCRGYVFVCAPKVLVSYFVSKKIAFKGQQTLDVLFDINVFLRDPSK